VGASEIINSRDEFNGIPLVAGCIACLLERLHDRGVVWSFEVQKRGFVESDIGELGHRFF
jgi:hypothetical protein